MKLTQHDKGWFPLFVTYRCNPPLLCVGFGQGVHQGNYSNLCDLQLKVDKCSLLMLRIKIQSTAQFLWN